MKSINRFPYTKVILSYLFIALAITLNPSYAMSEKMLRVGVSNSTPNISSVEQNETIPKGFGVELAELFANILGLKVELHAMDDTKLIKALNDGKVDIVIGIMDDSYLTTNMIKTSVQANRIYYINNQCLTFASLEDLPDHTIAIEKGRTLSWLLPSQMDINFIETESQEEALALVDSGKAQVYVSNDSGETIYLIEKKGFRNIKPVGMPIEAVPLVLAVNKSNPDLLSSLSITYGKILEDGRYHRIYYKWLGNDLKSIILGRYRKHIITVSLFMIFVFLLSITWSFLLKIKVNKIKEKFRKSEQKYRDLIESSPDMIYLISPKGEIRLMNEIALRNLGYNKKEITSLTLHDLVLPEQSGDVTDFIDGAFLNEYSNKEFTIITKNGERINVEVVATIFKEADITENLACCFSRDLTERKRLEEELIHSDRLAIIGRMAAGIAHEINNPLWIILSNTEDMLSHQLSQEELHECLKSIERNGLRAAKSIEHLLTFARPAPMKVVAIDLIKLIEDSLIFLKQRLKKKNIRVEKNYSSESIYLQGDEPSIQQLLINIILNAVQALDNNGSIIISVSITEKYGDGVIVLEIRDNGKGIPDKELQYIFNPFYTSGKTKGFGLGLFMSKIIVEKHRGDISVRSQLGKGSIFTICFPAEVETKPELQKSICKGSIHE